MQVRWLMTAITANANTRKTIASPVYNGPILIRGGSWGNVPSAGAGALDFGYVEGDSGTPGNGVGLVIENNVSISPVAPVRPYIPFNIHRMQNDASALVEGFIEFGGNTGPNNWRPLHFVIPHNGRVVVSFHNNTGAAVTVGVNLEIVEAIPQGFLDCLRHLVM